MTAKTSSSGMSTTRKISAAVIAAIVATTVAVNVSGGDNGGHKLVARFADASPLLVGNEVRLDGVKVGKITKLKVVDKQAEVTMQLSDSALPLHSDAHLTIRPVSLLGERYVDLDRGSVKAPTLHDGALLPVSQTAQSTDLDQVLNAVDDPTGNALAALVTMLGQGADGNGKNVAATIKALGPAMNDTTKLAGVLNKQNSLLLSTLDSLTPVADALARDNGKTLDELVGAADHLLGKTSANEAALRQTLSDLPQTLVTARRALASLARTGQATTPTLKSLKPVTGDLKQISQELQDFADAADPALASAEPVLKKANELLAAAAPVVNALSAAGPAIVTSAQAANPIVAATNERVVDIFQFIKNWALTTNGYDGLSHYFRAMYVVTPLTATGLVPGLGTNLGVGGDVPKIPGTVPGPQDPKSGLPGLTAKVRNVLKDTVGGLLAPGSTKDGGVTGMTAKQEQGGLLSLLGLGGL